MDDWYVGVSGQQRGPLSLDDAIATVRSAGAGQTYVWREGFAEWKLAGEVPEIASRLGARPPAAPAMGQRHPVQGAGSYEPDTTYSQGRGTSFPQAVASGFRNYVNFKGRASRSEFWFWVLFVCLVIFATSLVDTMLSTNMTGGGILTGIAVLGLILPGLAVTVRRLHDTDRSAWWILISFVPLVGGILLLVLECMRGTNGPNRFGDDPLGT